MRKVLILSSLTFLLLLCISSCERASYNITFTGAAADYSFSENDTIHSFHVPVAFDYNKELISQLKGFSSAYATPKPYSNYYLHNVPTSIKVYTNVAIGNTWQANDDVTSWFLNNENPLSDPFSWQPQFESPARSSYFAPELYLTYNADLDLFRPGIRKFKIVITFTDGSIFESDSPSFYLL